MVLLPEISNNVHQTIYSKLHLRKTLPIYKAQHLQFNFTAQTRVMINWVKEIGHQMLLQKLYRKFPKTGWHLLQD